MCFHHARNLSLYKFSSKPRNPALRKRRAVVSHLHSAWSVSPPALECLPLASPPIIWFYVLLFNRCPLDFSGSRPPLSSLCFLHFIAPSSILSESLTITHQSTCLPLSGQSIRSIISMPPPESPTSVRRESLYNGEKKRSKI